MYKEKNFMKKNIRLKLQKKNTIFPNSSSIPLSNSPLPNPLNNPILNQQMLMQLNALTNPMNQMNTSRVDQFLNSLSNNKIFIGFVMIMLNIGGRYLMMELPKNIDNLFNNSWMRLLIVFCISFMGTRDIKISIIITLIFILFMKYLFHEESKMCLLPKYNNPSMNNPSMNNMINNGGMMKKNEENGKKEEIPLPLNSPVIIIKQK
jgi:hypothetical protein